MMLIIYTIIFIVSIYLAFLCWDSDSDNRFVDALFNTGSVVFVVIALISFLVFICSIPVETGSTSESTVSMVIEE